MRRILNSAPLTQGPDLEGEDADCWAALHELTRYHRHVQRRRSNIARRFLSDKATIAEAVKGPRPAFTDKVTDLPQAIDMPEGAVELFSKRVSTRRAQLTGQLDLEELSRLLTLAARCSRVAATQFDNIAFSLRPYPSAGALFPCDIVVVPGSVDGLGTAPLRYDAQHHSLIAYGAQARDFRSVELQTYPNEPPCTFVITASLGRTMAKYGPRGYRFALLEAGHIGQSLALAASALGLQSLVSGSFFDAEVERWFGLDGQNEVVLSVVMVGGRARNARHAVKEEL